MVCLMNLPHLTRLMQKHYQLKVKVQLSFYFSNVVKHWKSMQHCSLFLVLCFACRQAAKNKGQGIKDMSFVFCCFFSLLFVHWLLLLICYLLIAGFPLSCFRVSLVHLSFPPLLIFLYERGRTTGRGRRKIWRGGKLRWTNALVLPSLALFQICLVYQADHQDSQSWDLI